MIDIFSIFTLTPPFRYLEESVSVEEFDTDICDEIVLESPILLITGYELNTNNGRLIRRDNFEINYTIEENISLRVFRNNSIKTFYGEVIINFSSRYPLKNYSNISKNDNLIVGYESYNYQYQKAEIKYKFGENGKESIYKKGIVIKENMSGSDNTILRFKLLYKGKQSKEESIEFRIIKV